MLFNSAVFLLLFAAVYSLYWFFPLRWKQGLIIAASLIFYGWYSIPFLLLFLAVIAFNYPISRILLEKKSKPLLWFAVSVDVGLLAFFKYFYLIAEGIGHLIANDYLISLYANWKHDYDFEIILPIAISFYTFQILAFLVDCYRGTIREKIPFYKYILFILFFPQFVAGPIMRSIDFIPQIDRPTITPERMLDGCLLLLLGTLKKVLIADRLGLLTGEIWSDPKRYDALYLLIVLPAFLVQVYCDFSGYTDIARGLAKLLGYEIPENFRGPFLSKSMQELWSRWHITLSTWLRDYIYIPLGGSRVGRFRTSLNILATMTIGGIWHGATAPMVLWGFYLGVILVIERFFGEQKIRILPDTPLTNPLRTFITFSLMSFSVIFFASPNFDTTIAYATGLFTFHRGIPGSDGGTLIALLCLALVLNAIQYGDGIKNRLRGRLKTKYALVFTGTVFVTLLVDLYGDVTGSFIYFRF